MAKFYNVSKYMVYGNLIMEIYNAYELDLEGYAIQIGIEYKVIKSTMFKNAHFHGLRAGDKTSKYKKLKQVKKRTLGPKAIITFKPINPVYEDKELANVVARDMPRLI